MKLELSFNNLSIKGEEPSEDKRKAVAAAKAKRKDSTETIEEAFERVSLLNFDEKEQELLRLAKEGYAAGKIGRLSEGKLNKGEVLSMGMQLKKANEEIIRAKRIEEVIKTKPENFYVITKDSHLSSVIHTIRDECNRQQIEWKDRFKVLGVHSMTAGDFEGTGIDSYMDLSIGFSIWLPILKVGFYLAYGHVDMRGVEGFRHIPEEYAFKEGDEQLTRSKVIEAISPYLSDKNHGKTFHMGDPRYDLHIAENDGYTIGGMRWDTLDAMKLMTEHLDRYGLKPLVQRYGKYIKAIGEKEIFTFDDLFGNGSPAPFGTEITGIYAIWDVYYGWNLFEWQFETMKKTGRLLECYAEIDSFLPETDVFMARAGFNISLSEIEALDEEFSGKLADARKDLFDAYKIDSQFLIKMSATINWKKITDWVKRQKAKKVKLEAQVAKQDENLKIIEGEGKTHLKKYTNTQEQKAKYLKQLSELTFDYKDSKFMIESFDLTNNNHLGYLIYDVLKIEDKTSKVQRGKSRSTAAAVLDMYYEDEESLKPLAIIASYEKLLSTYVKKIPVALEGDGRFHTAWKSMGTSTGRYSSAGYTGRRIDALDEFKV